MPKFAQKTDMTEEGRNYGFKHIADEYAWMTPGWIEELLKHEPDEEVRDYVSMILEDLTTPEGSRLVGNSDRLDCLEDYCVNRILAYGIPLEEDRVYKWLQTSIDFFARNDAFELCYNIQKAIEICRRQISGARTTDPAAIS